MVRVFIKGGVWKNTEDEILKAAVMKYGKQQWARVASLLNRKSAKQCKARWNEWLDPSVRKVEWSREEDEKLLHLAKLMPAQWRTIGPLVGRTASQCQERYERLLDEAAAADGGAGAGGDGLAGGAGEARKLRPGEIDPHPETKPARPDPVDMDEDEIEMLQEARARLANTQGKKAKRKQRERMLVEARRLADLQKRRELKAAGLLTGKMRRRARRRNRDIDLGVEIPFHKPAPAGFHSTEDEDLTAERIRNQRLRDVDFRRLNEANYRSRDREAKERQKREEARLRSLERSNMQYVVAEVSKRNDPIATRKRGVLTMPEPAVGDDELRRVAKLGEEEREAAAAALGAAQAGGATDALLGDYSDRPLPTPMRTPAASAMAGKISASEAIQREAMNLRALSTGQTPLLGEANAVLHGGAELSGPARAAVYGSTPAAAAMGGGLGSGDGAEHGLSMMDDATAGGRSARTAATPHTLATSGTARRDELGLNAPDGPLHQRPPSELRSVVTSDDRSVGASSFGGSTFASSRMSVRELAREERRRAKRARKELEEALAGLPAPQFEYELAVPEDVTMEEADEDERGNVDRAVDQADADAEELAEMRRRAEKLYEEQSSVLKRAELPRPRGGRDLLSGLDSLLDGDDALGSATALIHAEMVQMIHHDAHSDPVSADKGDPVVAAALSGGGGKKDKKGKKRKAAATAAEVPEVELEIIPEGALDGARRLLADELKAVIGERRDELAKKGRYIETDDEVVVATLDETLAARLGGGTGQSFAGGRWSSSESEEGEATTLRAEYEAVTRATAAVSKACDKLQQRLAVQTGGYAARSTALTTASMQSFAELGNSLIESSVYSRLRGHEVRGAALRTERLAEDVERMEEMEAEKQRRYGELLHERNRLALKIRAQSGGDKEEQ